MFSGHAPDLEEKIITTRGFGGHNSGDVVEVVEERGRSDVRAEIESAVLAPAEGHQMCRLSTF